jgi:hypothetical protein
MSPNTLIIDELGLVHAKSRIDVAVINGCIHGYEIKSAKDSLERLVPQLDIYSQALQKLTFVTAPRHVGKVLTTAPNWCGVIEAMQGPRGGIRLDVIRRSGMNPDINPVMMAHLLWRTEVIDLLCRAGFAQKDLRRPRRQLYEMLCEALTVPELTRSIRTFMAQRQEWRCRSARA